MRRLHSQGHGFPDCYLIEDDQAGTCLVYRTGGSIRILSSFAGGPILRILEVAVKLCDVLGRLHSAGVIHRDIKPASILWDEKARQVTLLDLGLSIETSRGAEDTESGDGLEGTLGYLSPEQTGRTNRPLDYRTDYYSFGISLYELLTGTRPFAAEDAIGMVHAHIAKTPQAPSERRPAVPGVLSRIVLKLMAKNAEDRYQSAGGLKHDLERCLSELRRTESVADFPLASRDVSSQFRIPHKLYGREREREVLLASLNSACTERSEIVLVSGYSGIGKSSLIHELYGPVAGSRGFFVSGKFDQFMRNVPYSALSRALSALAESILTLDDEALAEFRNRILGAVGHWGQVILDLAPEFESIIGPQPEMERLEPAEAQNRLGAVFTRFIEVMARPDAPFVIFLDDLQWADSPTLVLLGQIMRNAEGRGLLMVGAYRDNEVGPDHPLMGMIDGLRHEKVPVRQVTLAPLRIESIEELISDTLHADRNEVKDLARLVMRKTDGNPFFVSQFLETLVQENLIRFSFDENRWKWDVEGIRAAGITENVAELMVGLLRKMPETTQQMMQVAACVGNSFDLRTISAITSTSAPRLKKEFRPALQAGLLLAVEDWGPTEPEPELEQVSFRFLHDRVQQAAYSLIRDDERERFHLEIGTQLLRESTRQERDEKLFEIVLHLNRARALLTEVPSVIELTELNLEAGLRARESVAFGPMLEFMTVASECVSRVEGDVSDGLAESVYLGAAEANDLNGNFDAVEDYLAKASRHHTGLLGELNAAKIRFHALAAQGRAREGLIQGLALLNRAGISVSIDSRRSDVILAFLKMKLRLAFTNFEKIEKRPELKDPVKLSALELCILMVPPAANSTPWVYALLVIELARSFLDDGPSPKGALGIAGFSMLLAQSGDYAGSRKYDRISQHLVMKFGGPKEIIYGESGKTYFARVMWTRFRDLAEYFRLISLPYAYEAGNLEMVVANMLNPMAADLLGGESVSALARRIPALNAQAEKYHQETMHSGLRPFLQVIDCLADPDWDGSLLTGPYYDEPTSLAELERGHDAIGILHACVCSAYIDILFGRPDEALPKLIKAKEMIPLSPLTLFNGMLFFLSGLANLARYRVSGGTDRKALRMVRKDLRKLRIFSREAPYNFEQQFLLVEAELKSARGKARDAEVLYERTIEVALKNGLDQDAALANELYSGHLSRTNERERAFERLREAYALYSRWGASAKVKQLERKFPALSEGDRPLGGTADESFVAYSPNGLDLATVVKASRLITEEIRLDRLLSRMIKVMAENAGAGKAVMILNQANGGADKLLVQASWSEGQEPRVMQAQPLDDRADVIVALVRYVARSHEVVTLGNASEQGNFRNDSYVVSRKPKSVLAVPILTQGRLLGVLYLENNIAYDAFTPSRIEVLQILCSQSAVSLNNALLYASLEDKVEERTAKLQETIEQLNDEKARIIRLHEELEVQRAKGIQGARMAALGEMAGGIAHEINTPLAVIQIYAERAKEMIETGNYDQAILGPAMTSISSTVSRIAEIIVALRNFSRDASGDPLVRVPLSTIVNDTVMLCRERFREGRVEIQLRELPPVLIECRPIQISQALLNLISNAYDAVLRGSGSRWVRIGIEETEDFAVLSVADSGPGVPVEIRDKIFQPFFTTKEIGRGTGLGLSVAKGIVESHRGSLSYDSTAAVSTFSMTLPKVK